MTTIILKIFGFTLIQIFPNQLKRVKGSFQNYELIDLENVLQELYYILNVQPLCGY